jgi:hypothetical protein
MFKQKKFDSADLKFIEEHCGETDEWLAQALDRQKEEVHLPARVARLSAGLHPRGVTDKQLRKRALRG